MFDDQFDYVAHVSAAGYEWIPGESFRRESADPGEHVTGNLLVPRLSAGSEVARAIQPDHQDPALFRDFADLDTSDPDSLLAFANQYGFLEHGERGRTEMRAELRAEAFADWVWHIDALRCVIRVHDLVQEGDLAALAPSMTWQPAGPGRPNGRWVFHGYPGWWGGHRSVFTMPSEWPADLLSAYPGLPPPQQPGLRPSSYPVTMDSPTPGDDLRLVARAWLYQVVTDTIGHSVNVRLNADRATGKARLRVIPSSLCQLLWFQFSRALIAGKDYRRCKECRGWFELPPRERDRKVFCSPACKVKDQRTRKARVAELRTGGRTPKQIADAMGMDIETVRAWIKSTQAKGK